MDFFAAQALAKRRTARLVALFVLAVAGTVLALYAAIVLILSQSGDSFSVDLGDASGWWQPRLLIGVATVTLCVIAGASLFKWVQFSRGGSAVAEELGGRHVDPRTSDFNERRLLNVVEEMAIASGTPVPAVYVLDDEPGLNAFAAGLTTSDAVVAVTRGTLEKLNRDELQGVIGHEFSHILNGDMRLNVRISALLFGILVLGLIGRGLLESLRRVRPSRSRNEKNSGGLVAGLMLLGLALLVIGYVGWFFGRLIQAAVSRQREYLADAAAVQFTRNPGGIAGALKKIGGYAIGSALHSAKSAEIGHFFFAQGFRSMFGGLWATHPPLVERIRAIEPSFDGRFFEPPEVVDVELKSFIEAGFARPAHAGSVRTATTAAPLAEPPILAPAAAVAALAAVGTLTPDQIENAQSLLATVPPFLREAARDPGTAPAVLYVLLLAKEAEIRRRQCQLVADRSGAAAAAAVEHLTAAADALGNEQRLPVLQLALPAIRRLAPGALEAFLHTLDELVHADTRVSTFEFALQKLVSRTLQLGRSPGTAIAQFHSLHAVADEISVVLSALAHAATATPAQAPTAFQAGARHLRLIEGRLRFLAGENADLVRLDTALDQLARATLPIKERVLRAAAEVVGADGRLLITEAELLRAIAAALDCPMPPILGRQVQDAA